LIALDGPWSDDLSVDSYTPAAASKETGMFSSTRMTYDVANARHQQHLEHAARIRELQVARKDAPPVNRSGHRLVTVARLAVASALQLVR
jgi:hypothetical protein